MSVEVPASHRRYNLPTRQFPRRVDQRLILRAANQRRTGKPDIPEGDILRAGPYVGKTSQRRHDLRRDLFSICAITGGGLRRVYAERVFFESLVHVSREAHILLREFIKLFGKGRAAQAEEIYLVLLDEGVVTHTAHTLYDLRQDREFVALSSTPEPGAKASGISLTSVTALVKSKPSAAFHPCRLW